MSTEPDAPIVCYLLQTHREPALVGRIVKTLLREDSNCKIVLMQDSTREPVAEWDFASDRVRSVQSTDSAGWGTWGQTVACLEGVRSALETGWHWDWLVLLTGQSYPLLPSDRLASWLDRDVDAVFDFSRGGYGSESGFWSFRPFGADRARYCYFNLPPSPIWRWKGLRQLLIAFTGRQPFAGFSFYSRTEALQQVQAQFLIYNPSSVFARGVRPLQAGQCWGLRRAQAARLLDLLDTSSEWSRHFRHSFTSDELSIPSYIAHLGAVIEDDVLHAQRWPSGPSPRTLDLTDWDWIAAQDAPFVRKVTAVGGQELLERIDAKRRAFGRSDR